MFFKKNKEVRAIYKLKLTKFEVAKLIESINNQILDCMTEIETYSKEFNKIMLYDLIMTKRTLMLTIQYFGSNIYDDEIKKFKPVMSEIKIIEDETKEKNNVLISNIPPDSKDDMGETL